MTLSATRDGNQITIRHSPTGTVITEDVVHVRYFRDELNRLLGGAEAEAVPDPPAGRGYEDPYQPKHRLPDDHQNL
jgi:hypothetical protein